EVTLVGEGREPRTFLKAGGVIDPRRDCLAEPGHRPVGFFIGNLRCAGGLVSSTDDGGNDGPVPGGVKQKHSARTIQLLPHFGGFPPPDNASLCPHVTQSTPPYPP